MHAFRLARQIFSTSYRKLRRPCWEWWFYFSTRHSNFLENFILSHDVIFLKCGNRNLFLDATFKFSRKFQIITVSYFCNVVRYYFITVRYFRNVVSCFYITVGYFLRPIRKKWFSFSLFAHFFVSLQHSSRRARGPRDNSALGRKTQSWDVKTARLRREPRRLLRKSKI